MQNSILIIVMVMICTIVLAVLFAALLSRGNFRGKNFFRIYFLHTKHFEYCCYCRYFRCNLQSEYRTAQYIFGCDSSEWIKASVDGRSEYCYLFCDLCTGMAGQSDIIWSCICPVWQQFRKISMKPHHWMEQQRFRFSSR